MPIQPAGGAEIRQLPFPTFGSVLRRLRDERRVSREKLAFETGVSTSYISHLENGVRANPTRSVVEALVRYLRNIRAISGAELRYLFDLAGLSTTDYPGVDALRSEISGDMRHRLTLHEPTLAAYLDTRWNVLACNDSFAAAFPGVAAEVSLLRWLFGSDIARGVLVEWEAEARVFVHWLRGLSGQEPEATWPGDVLAQLAEYPDFRRLWHEGNVAYGRDRPEMLIADPATGRADRVAVQVFRLDSGNYPGRIQFFVGTRLPQSA
ncbi:helix-turn-helix domain-containing protein [Nocardia xishanensis]